MPVFVKFGQFGLTPEIGRSMVTAIDFLITGLIARTPHGSSSVTILLFADVTSLVVGIITNFVQRSTVSPLNRGRTMVPMPERRKAIHISDITIPT